MVDRSRILAVRRIPQSSGLEAGLAQAGFEVDWVRDGVAALHTADSDSHAAVILDLGLPRLAGFEVLERIRERGPRLPVLILTARDAIEDRVRGLDGGADDYLVKPADLDELAARPRGLIRRWKARSMPAASDGSRAARGQS